MECAVSAYAQNPPPAPTAPATATSSVVYRAHNDDAIHDYKVNQELVRRMTNALVLAVTRQPDVASAWRSLLKPNDRIGIKISAAGGELFTTHRAIVNTIVDGIVAAGHARRDIVVWDKSLGGIKEAGYTGNEGYQLKSIPPLDGYNFALGLLPSRQALQLQQYARYGVMALLALVLASYVLPGGGPLRWLFDAAYFLAQRLLGA